MLEDTDSVFFSFVYLVQPSIVEHPVIAQSVYPGEMVNFSCRAAGFSTLSYSWFMVESGSDIGMKIENATIPTYTISNPIYDQSNTGYYCVASNNEGVAVSNTSTLTGKYIIRTYVTGFGKKRLPHTQYQVTNLSAVDC